MMKDNPLGSTFAEGNVTLMVMPSMDFGKTCTGCWYAGKHGKNRNLRNYNGSCFEHGHACTPANRKDRKQVVFMKLKEG